MVHPSDPALPVSAPPAIGSAELAGWLAETGTPGVQFAGAGPGAGPAGTTAERVAGVVGPGETRPVTRRTRFQACSISKPIAVTAVMRLVDRGMLDLDADIRDSLDGWVPRDVGGAPVRVTLRELASHSGGIGVPSFPGYPRDGRIPSLRDVLDGVGTNTDPVRRVGPPGRCAYSGGGTTIVQAVLETVVGEPYPELIRREVLEPFGMRDSSAAVAGAPGGVALEGVARGRRADGPVPGGWQVYPEAAAAGLWTTAGDLVRWATGIAAAWRGEPAPISRAAARAMVDVVAPTDEEPWLGGLDAAGLGVFVRTAPEVRVFGHTGSNDGYRSHVLADAVTGRAVAVMADSDTAGPLLQRIVERAPVD